MTTSSMKKTLSKTKTESETYTRFSHKNLSSSFDKVTSNSVNDKRNVLGGKGRTICRTYGWL